MICLSAGSDDSDAAQNGTWGELTWSLDDTGVLTISGNGAMPDATSSERPPYDAHKDSIKKVVISQGVTSIGKYAFYNYDKLTQIEIPASVTAISVSTTGIGAINGCTSLESVTVDSGNTKYESKDGVLFDKTENGLILYPAKKTGDNYETDASKIYYGAFSGNTNLKTVSLTNVSYLGSYAFGGCTSLVTADIKGTLTDMGTSTFSGCESLESVTVDSGNTKYESRDGVLFDKTENGLILYPAKKTGDNYETDASKIYYGAFSGNTNLKTVSLTNVSYLGSNAFGGCASLVTADIKGTLTDMGTSTFSGCESLESVNIPKSVTSIYLGYDGYRPVFYQCYSLKAVNVEEGSEKLESKDGVVFDKKNNSLILYPVNKEGKEYTVPAGVKTLSQTAFGHSSGSPRIEKITLGAEVSSIGQAFSTCSSLTQIVVVSNNPVYKSEDGVVFTKDGKTLVSYPVGKKDNSYTVPDGVTTIDKYAFQNNKNIKHISMPNVTKIDNYAFSGCTYLNSVNMPVVVTIGERSFSYCSYLTSVTLPNTLTSNGFRAFDECFSLVEVCNNSALVLTPGATSNGRVAHYAVNIYSDGSGTSILNKEVSDYVFMEHEGKKYLVKYLGNNAAVNVSATDSVYGIWDYAFYVNADVRNVSIAGVKEIKSYAFAGCTSLSAVDMPDVVNVSKYAFDGCGSLTSVTLPAYLNVIEDNAFNDCRSLVEVCNNSTLTVVAGEASNGGVGLYAVNVYSDSSGETVLIKDVNDFVFMEYDGKAYLVKYVGSDTSVILPEKDTLYGIWNYAFYVIPDYGFDSLSITISDSVDTIGKGAFGNANISDIKFGSGLTSIDATSFEGITFYDSDGTTVIESTADNLKGLTFVKNGVKLVKPGPPAPNDPDDSDESSSLPFIIGGVVGVLVVAGIAGFIFVRRK